MSTLKAAAGFLPAALWAPSRFQYGSLTISVKRATVGDMLARDRVYLALKRPGDEAFNHYANHFASCVVQTVSIEGQGAPALPPPSASPADLVAGFESWLAWCDQGLINRWVGAILESNRPPGNPDTDGDDLADAEKKG